MPLDTLKARLPDYAKDLRLNLSSLATEPTLTEQQRAGTFIASALAARNPEVTGAIMAEFTPQLAPEALEAAKAAAAIMSMNNIYYRFTHLASAADYRTLPAKLRMNVIGKPGVAKADFELWSLAVSAINGCGMCIDAHASFARPASAPRRSKPPCASRPSCMPWRRRWTENPVQKSEQPPEIRSTRAKGGVPVHKTKNSLSEAVRTKSITLLARNLALAIDLSLQTKQAHWNVKGPNFIALHELFDKISDEVREFVDLMAERITALGGTAEGTLQAVGPRTTLAPYSLTITSGPQHLEALSSALAAFGSAVRQAIDESAGFGDADTADLFTEVSRETDKQLWFLEAHLQS